MHESAGIPQYSHRSQKSRTGELGLILRRGSLKLKTHGGDYVRDKRWEYDLCLRVGGHPWAARKGKTACQVGDQTTSHRLLWCLIYEGHNDNHRTTPTKQHHYNNSASPIVIPRYVGMLDRPYLVVRRTISWVCLCNKPSSTRPSSPSSIGHIARRTCLLLHHRRPAPCHISR